MRDDYSGAVAEPAEPPSARAKQLARVQELVASRTPTQRDADRRLFLSRIKDADARQDFERHVWMSALNARAIFAFWDEVAP